MRAASHDDDREAQGLALENTGSSGKRLAAIGGRALKAELRKAAEGSKKGGRK